ncbi:hypothetical protein ASD37_29980 [Mycobacterium sp. Root135]|uniref:TetR/AcrR family transcriptional regulator n=1 Tax=Mycobacterium sp. Root135 TaxID=1736457 RepID=UPI0006FCB67E|nr:acyl-CoA dehydrogenase family protein [Mycobacterium sp. Root135]KQY01275.1 hypothetical protein ASD37_29980 [Mycobacterium sp. Root135]
MVKLKATELAKLSTLECMQMLGGYLYATEYGMEELVRSALASTNVGGTSEVQRDIIAKTLGLGSRRPSLSKWTPSNILMVDLMHTRAMAVVSGETQERRRGRPKASDGVPLDTILAVALRQFALLGYDGASLRTINRELGVSHNVLHQRFGTKEGLWRAAVDHGFGGLVGYMQSVFDPTITEPLEQLRLALRQFLVYSHAHPELLALMNYEGRQSTERLDYIFRRYITPSQTQIVRLLAHLADDGTIRRIPHSTFFFLATHGGAAPFTLAPLAAALGSPSPTAANGADVEKHADLVSTVLIEGLRLRPVKARRKRP